MKVIIFEGLDNTGKSTQIQLLTDYYKSTGCTVCVKHFSMPPKELSNKEKVEYQNNEYINYVKELIRYNNEKLYDYVFIDRCWYSEYVYSQIYRDRNELELLFNIFMFEESLMNYLGKHNVKLFMFRPINPEFSVMYEDGHSISEGDIDKISAERKLFDRIYKQSEIHDKQVITVNDFFKPELFRSKDNIFDEIKTTVYKDLKQKPIYSSIKD